MRDEAMALRNRLVVRLRDDGLTYSAIAKWFGISTDRARQIDHLEQREAKGRGRRAALIAAFRQLP